MYYTYSLGRAHNELTLQLQHQVEFPVNTSIAITKDNYIFRWI